MNARAQFPDALAGQTHARQIEALTIFGAGLLGGVTTAYSGIAPLAISGGYSRTLPLVYPAMLGAPLTSVRTRGKPRRRPATLRETWPVWPWVAEAIPGCPRKV